MTANPISARLRSCQGLADTMRDVLEEALDLAKSHGYKQDWIDALSQALRYNQESWSHIGNVATLIELVAPPIPH